MVADMFSVEERSRVMARIKSKNTTPEISVRRALHAEGFRFRIHRSDLPGNPDIVLPKHRAVMFVNGCFWHRHKGCRRASVPKSNKDYWTKKLRRNVVRFEKNRRLLRKMGWRVLVVWECQTKDIDKLRILVRKKVHARSGPNGR